MCIKPLRVSATRILSTGRVLSGKGSSSSSPPTTVAHIDPTAWQHGRRAQGNSRLVSVSNASSPAPPGKRARTAPPIV